MRVHLLVLSGLGVNINLIQFEIFYSLILLRGTRVLKIEKLHIITQKHKRRKYDS